MAINYITPSSGGTLSPPILNGIEEINTPTNLILGCDSGSGNLNLNGWLQILCYNAAANVDFDVSQFTIQTSLFQINCNLINLNGTVAPYILQMTSLTTANILLITPVVGMQVFNSTLNQMFWYQVSPITGLVLGWYNSTGNINL